MPIKKVRDVFSDYNTDSVIKDAVVKALNVSKKDNTLEMILKSPEYIEIKEIWFLEKFLMDRFKFTDVNTKIKYEETANMKNIGEEWNNIICYIAHKYPLAKKMLLNKSDVEVVENTINVNVNIPGTEFLKSRGADKRIRKTIENLFGKKYKINLRENASKEIIDKIKENGERIEKNAVTRMLEKTSMRATQNNVEVAAKPEKEKKFVPNRKSNDKELIIGRSKNFKDEIVKIEELTVNDGRVAIAGDILKVETRVIRSRKDSAYF